MKNYVTDDIPFSDRYMFAKVMGDNQDLCKQLAELILGCEIELQSTDTEVSIIQVTKASVRLDLLIKAKNKVITIEMQASPDKEIPKRSRYYRGLVDARSLNKGQSYKDLLESYVIFLCKEDPLKGGLAVYTIKQIVLEDRSIDYPSGTTDILLNASADKDKMPTSLVNLLNYIKTQEVTEDDEFIAAIDSAVKCALADESWRQEVQDYNYEIEVASHELEVARREIDVVRHEIEVTRKKAKVARNEGREEGRAEGIEIGRTNGRIHEIESLVADGILTPEQGVARIERIKQETVIA